MLAHQMLFAAGGVVTAVSARYWRLLATDLNWYNDSTDKYLMQVYTLSMFTSKDCTGTDLARAATALASTTYSTFYPSNVKDGDNSTRWISYYPGSTTYEWIGFDFGSPVTIKSILLMPYYDTSGAIFAKTANIQYSSNGTAWTTLKSVSVPDQSTTSFTNLQ